MHILHFNFVRQNTDHIHTLLLFPDISFIHSLYWFHKSVYHFLRWYIPIPISVLISYLNPNTPQFISPDCQLKYSKHISLQNFWRVPVLDLPIILKKQQIPIDFPYNWCIHITEGKVIWKPSFVYLQSRTLSLSAALAAFSKHWAQDYR